MSHDPSEIILICWFAAREAFLIIIINAETTRLALNLSCFSFSGLFWCQSAARTCKRQPGGPAEVCIRRRWLLHRSHAARPAVREEPRRPSGRGHVWLHLHAQGRERLSGEGEEGEETAHRTGGRLSSRGVLWVNRVADYDIRLIMKANTISTFLFFLFFHNYIFQSELSKLLQCLFYYNIYYNNLNVVWSFYGKFEYYCKHCLNSTTVKQCIGHQTN